MSDHYVIAAIRNAKKAQALLYEAQKGFLHDVFHLVDDVGDACKLFCGWFSFIVDKMLLFRRFRVTRLVFKTCVLSWPRLL